MKAVLYLENGILFRGINFGASGEVAGEVVFNTSMTGYQEILTDPSYYGQIVTMTYTQIGNYGVNYCDLESEKVRVAGFITREYFDFYSNYRAKGDLQSYLKKNNIVSISEIDTRMLTRLIRLSGAMKGIISTETDKIKILKEKLDKHPRMEGSDLVKFVTCKEEYNYNNESYTPGNNTGNHYSVVAFDYGIKYNILKCLSAAGFKIKVVPASTTAEQALNLNPDGILLSNGPGDPAAVGYAISNIARILGQKPVFGICLGHQMMALAMGARTYKLKFGHHGGNHPVKNLETGKVEITTQNHGFAVERDSLKKIKGTSFKITHMNLNDNTIEGVEYPEIYAYSVQHHPEAGPGPYDSRYIFSSFKKYIQEFNKT